MWRYTPNSEDEYVGNIWGWRFSMFGAALIVVMLGIAFLVARSRGVSIIDGGKLSSPPPQEQSR